MCGIGGIFSVERTPVRNIRKGVSVIGSLIAHRGPDGEGVFVSPNEDAALAHRRLSIIDLTEAAAQPMKSAAGHIIAYNGEIYNYIELRDAFQDRWSFRTTSDTETILAGYALRGADIVNDLRGMFAFAIVDGERLFCARDRFGIKPFFYAIIDNVFYFSSEMKALLPFLPEVATDPEALSEYLTFQYTISEQTLFKHIRTLMPGHTLIIENGQVKINRYWDIRYEIDYDHTHRWFAEQMRGILSDSIHVHLRSDVPVGAYISGGIDSSLIAIMAAREDASAKIGFHGKFVEFPGYDESPYAEAAAKMGGIDLRQIEITAHDFRDNIEKVIHHLDAPIAGPGSFPQYMVSKLASEHVKVVLGGQGGDEIFGGYARYLIAYFEQSIKAALDGTYRNGNFVVTPESIIPQLESLREYKPLIRQLFSEGLFGPLDERYFRLSDRSTDMQDEVDWSGLDRGSVFERFQQIFNSSANVRKEAYFDSMTHFDFKCLLPALLQVEDRMSMAHGLEARVPLLDHKLVELAATIPADIKFKNGRMKHFIKATFNADLPQELSQRRDKMGFPVPLKEWFSGELSDFTHDIFGMQRRKARPHFNSDAILANLDKTQKFSRKTWGLLSMELWHQIFHDRAAEYRKMVQ